MKIIHTQLKDGEFVNMLPTSDKGLVDLIFIHDEKCPSPDECECNPEEISVSVI
jgi:hypothetical protein